MEIFKTSLIFLTILLSSTALPAATNTTPNNPYTNDAYGSQADKVLLGRIRSKITSSIPSKTYSQLKIEVYNGAVTMQGPVDSMEDKMTIENGVKSINGVRSINSQLYVQSKAPTAPNDGMQADQALEKQIRDRIISNWSSQGYSQLQVQVNGGNVTLHGTVKSWGDKQAIEDNIRSMKGVNSVNSQLRVSG